MGWLLVTLVERPLLDPFGTNEPGVHQDAQVLARDGRAHPEPQRVDRPDACSLPAAGGSRMSRTFVRFAFSVAPIALFCACSIDGTEGLAEDDASFDSAPGRDSTPHDGGIAPRDEGIDEGSDVLKDQGTPADVTTPVDAPTGASCGVGGHVLHVADGIDVCMPPTVCTSETCPPPLGKCEKGVCTFLGSYRGLQTMPEAWATYYCTLSSGGCHGVTQQEFAEVTAGKIAKTLKMPLCEDATGKGTCVGIAASSPMVVGNSQVAIDPTTGKFVHPWGMGLTEASGLCYELTGPGGTTLVALTDRCGGYCKCGGSGYQECGPCVSAPDMQPNCACVGAVPGIADACCGRGCGTTKADCDWCASNNHPHFDLDTAAFDHLCGAEKTNGSCRIEKVRFVPCLTPSGWPPSGG
jgi:hypothetical protein